jgi:hypothetical protein
MIDDDDGRWSYTANCGPTTTVFKQNDPITPTETDDTCQNGIAFLTTSRPGGQPAIIVDKAFRFPKFRIGNLTHFGKEDCQGTDDGRLYH